MPRKSERGGATSAIWSRRPTCRSRCSARAGATEQEIVALGAALARWRAEYPPARHIWGLSDLLAGRPPRTPPPYIAVPFPTDGYEDRYEPVALVYVAHGTDLPAAASVLDAHLGALLETCAWIIDPGTYSDMNR